MDNSEDTSSSAQRSSSKRWLLFAVIAMVLVALSAGVILTKPGMSPLGFAPEVELVRDSRELAPWATVGEMFEQFLSDPKWEVIRADDGEVYVNLTGGLTYMKKPVEGKIQFSVDMDARRWEFSALEFNGVPQNMLILARYFNKVGEEFSSPFATAYREARRNIASIRTAEMAYFAEFGEYVSAAPHPVQMNQDGVAWGQYKDAGGFNELGFGPTNRLVGPGPEEEAQRLHCTYAVNRLGSAFTAAAKCNGGSEGPIVWGYVKPDQAGKVVAGPFGKCGVEGVWSVDGDLLGTQKVGLCSRPS